MNTKAMPMSYRRKRETHGTLPKMIADRLLTPEEAAIFLNIAVQTLAHWRSGRSSGPSYYRIGRAIRYSERSLKDWLESHAQASTTENERFG